MITIAGAGLAGLASAYELAKRGASVTIFEKSAKPGESSVARFAGGMLAPFCERESAEEDVVTLGVQAADWWSQVTLVTRHGTLVVTPPRDRAELTRFARRTSHFTEVNGQAISELEPALAGRFERGLFFKEEAHLDPRQALVDLTGAVQELGVEIHYGRTAPAQVDLNCTATASSLPDLRAVRGEMAILHCPEVQLSRVIRLLHPRMPLYLVPRADGLFMIGGTMVESNSERPPTLRSLTEMLSAAFAIHPAFAEASVVEIGAGLRPAFPDNLSRLVEHDGSLHLNGLYRHGFLLAPALAQQAAQHLLRETCT
ncbi:MULTISPECIES: FAD-dependent oxidoreductase [unclassified Pseudovibrio]|uniref:FAD-dependent oxidoreductase n=1 Tax=unclassified Pseudovibrio TaxID=2627060 RepID=UPI0007AE472C|nr:MULTISPECIES: FAD-dependent oxidoreductase [unclassified Pseudovibrio]KZL01042.1 Glycine oxidase [Pseudovibrio sp. W74]KZL11108.1 Glycine oxidase [Pseudovibrio sp. Ad14]